MAAPAPDLQDLPTTLANLGLLGGRINQLQARGATFRQTLQNALAGIVTRLAAIRAIIERQGGAGAELLQLQRQIREGAPTHEQIRTLNDIFQLIDPAALTNQLNALVTEVGQLERAVGIIPGEDQQGAAPVQGPQPRRGGFLYSRRANRSRSHRSKLRKKKSRKKRKKKSTYKKRKNKKYNKTKHNRK